MKILCSLFFCIISIFALGQNLITNPSAELDPTSNGWTQVSGSWVSKAPGVTTLDGGNYFFPGSNASAELYQDIDVSSYATEIDAGTQYFSFSGAIRSYGADQSQIKVEYRDASSPVLYTFDTGFQSYSTWITFCEEKLALTGTRTIRIRLLAVRNAGSDNDGYIDNLELISGVHDNGDNLIINGSCECEPTAKGWTQASGKWIGGYTQSHFDRLYYFFAGANASAELYQDVDVSSYATEIDAESRDFNFSAYVKDWNGSDKVQFIVEYRDSSSTVLDADTSSELGTTIWTKYSSQKTAPANTRTIRIRLFSIRYAGTDNDGYIDKVVLETNSTLPIKLLNFDAYLQNNSVVLQWQTASELNNDYFTIEKSKDNIIWNDLYQIAGAGNSNLILNYTSIDNNPYKGISYYRLKQTDFDGEYSCSAVKAINVYKLTNGVRIYPNPTNDKAYVVGNEDELKYIKIFNVLGQNVINNILIDEVSEGKRLIDLSKLNSGIYYLKTKTCSNSIYKQ